MSKTEIKWKLNKYLSNMAIDNLFQRFKKALQLKYISKRKEKGDSWFDIPQHAKVVKYLKKELQKHVLKEQWVDVGVFCMMLETLDIIKRGDDQDNSEFYKRMDIR